MSFLAAVTDTDFTPWGPLAAQRPDEPPGTRWAPSPRGALYAEGHWRERPRDGRDAGAGAVALGRWMQESNEAREHLAAPEAAHFVIEIALRSARAEIFAGGRSAGQGRLAAGHVQITAPGEEARGVFQGPCDLLHLFVPTALAETLCEGIAGAAALYRVARGPSWTDPVVERLGAALVKPDHLGGGIAGLYREGLGSAILARVLARGLHQRRAGSPGAGGLVRWRLKRVTDHVDANFAEPLRLADLARCAGLSRMHFAAQFRAATGLRPHEYVLRRRIDRARDLLRDSALPLVEVALSVGFQTQAHFSTVFRHLVGETPGRWRQLNGGGGTSCSS